MDYAVIGLAKEEHLFESHASYPHKAEHLQQHQDLRLKIRAIQQQIDCTDSKVVATRLQNVLNEWLTVHVFHTDMFMIRCCVPPTHLNSSGLCKSYSPVVNEPIDVVYLKKYSTPPEAN